LGPAWVRLFGCGRPLELVLRALLLALPDGSVVVCTRIADALTGALEGAR
jgi:hypothetical protein